MREALDVFSKNNLRNNEATALNNLGNLYIRQDKYKEAEKLYQSSLVISRELGDLYEEGRTLNNLAGVFKRQGRLDEAANIYQQCLTIRRKINNFGGAGLTLANLAVLQKQQGDITSAIDLQKQAVKAYEMTEDKQRLAEERETLSEWAREAEEQRKEEA